MYRKTFEYMYVKANPIPSGSNHRYARVVAFLHFKRSLVKYAAGDGRSENELKNIDYIDIQIKMNSDVSFFRVVTNKIYFMKLSIQYSAVIAYHEYGSYFNHDQIRKYSSK